MQYLLVNFMKRRKIFTNTWCISDQYDGILKPNITSNYNVDPMFPYPYVCSLPAALAEMHDHGRFYTFVPSICSISQRRIRCSYLPIVGKFLSRSTRMCEVIGEWLGSFVRSKLLADIRCHRTRWWFVSSMIGWLHPTQILSRWPIPA